MAHIRTRSLKAATRVLEGIPRVKSVSVGRRYPFAEDQLPAVRLSWIGEDPRRAGGNRPGVRLINRVSTLRVLIVDSQPEYEGDEPLEFGLDAIQLEVEQRLAANTTLPDDDGIATVRDVQPGPISSGENARGAQAVVVTALLFTVISSHREGDADIPYNHPGA